MSLNLPFGVFRSTRGDTDLKFRVADDSARNSLIINDLIDIGHIIYHIADNNHYKLDTYPTYGSLTGIVWKPVGNEKSSSITSTSEDTVATSKAVNDLKILIDSINTLLLSDDVTLDELQEIVDFIKQNKDDLDTLTISNISGLSDALDLKLERGGYTGTAQDLKTLIDNIDGFISVTKTDTNSWDVNYSTRLGNTVTLNFQDWFDTKMNVSTSLTPNALKFQNELGNWIVPKASTFFQTIYIDSTIPNSTSSIINESSFPFKTMEDGKNVLISSGLEYLPTRYYFLDDAVHQGTELLQTDTIFDARSTATIDFTGVNEGTSVISTIGDSDFSPTYDFIGGKINVQCNVVSVDPSYTCSFTPQYGIQSVAASQVSLVGEIGYFHWNCNNGGTTGFSENPFLALGRGSLIIRQLYITSLTNNVIRLTNQNLNLSITELIVTGITSHILWNYYQGFSGVSTTSINIDNISIDGGVITIGLRPTVGNITGTGNVSLPSAVYNDSDIDSTISLNTVNIGRISGKINTNTPITSNYSAGGAIFEDFEGYISNITMFSINVNARIIFRGNNKIFLSGTNRLANLNSVTHRDDVVHIESGFTVVQRETGQEASNIFLSNNANHEMLITTSFFTNGTNIGISTNRITTEY